MVDKELASLNRQRIDKILERLSTLDVERTELQNEVDSFKQKPKGMADNLPKAITPFSADQKIEIFLNLFRAPARRLISVCFQP